MTETFKLEDFFTTSEGEGAKRRGVIGSMLVEPRRRPGESIVECRYRAPTQCEDK